MRFDLFQELEQRCYRAKRALKESFVEKATTLGKERLLSLVNRMIERKAMQAEAGSAAASSDQMVG